MSLLKSWYILKIIYFVGHVNILTDRISCHIASHFLKVFSFPFNFVYGILEGHRNFHFTWSILSIFFFVISIFVVMFRNANFTLCKIPGQIYIQGVIIIVFFFFYYCLFTCLFTFCCLLLLFTYCWLHWVFAALCGLSLAAGSVGYPSLRCTCFSLRWLLLLWSELQ